MKHNKKWNLRALTATVVALCLCVGATLAVAGDRKDPLVTLSYLEDTAIDNIMDDVEQMTKSHKNQLEDDLEDLVKDYERDMKKLVEEVEGAEQVVSSSYELVTVPAGQRIALGVGCELMLRIGTATVEGEHSPALIDMTSGDSVEANVELSKNHLYMATIEGRDVVPVGGEIKVLIRGTYTVE